MNARLFPANWRPAVEEIAFAREAGFEAIQFPGPAEGLGRERLGDDLEVVAGALKKAGLTAVMEMVVHVQDDGRTEDGKTPLDVLKANLPAVTALACPFVHWHLVSIGTIEAEPIYNLEKSLLPQFIEAVEIARRSHFRFGLEHNEPDLMLFAQPESCQEILNAVPELGFVWDFNHTTPEDLTAVQALIPQMSVVHVSDSPLPEVNYHLPLGMGTIDFEGYCRSLLAGGFTGPAILEIGGLPKSGGYGRDTDAALIDSRKRLQEALLSAIGKQIL